MKMGFTKSVYVSTLIMSVLIIFVYNCDAEGMFDLYIKYYLKYIKYWS